jgi:hypothetical protein
MEWMKWMTLQRFEVAEDIEITGLKGRLHSSAPTVH